MSPESPHHSMPLQICVGCGKFMDSATRTTRESGPPAAGCLTICLYCGQAMVWREGMILERLSNEEFAQLDPQTMRQIIRVKAAVEAVQRMPALPLLREQARRA
jgi:hypothetical protein